MQDAALPLNPVCVIRMREQLGLSVFSRSDFRVSRISLKYVPRNGGRGGKGKEIRWIEGGARRTEKGGGRTVCGSTETVNIYGIARGRYMQGGNVVRWASALPA